MKNAKLAANKGLMISQSVAGGYMYLRSLIGPVDLLYKFYDSPELIHDCMKQWLLLGDAVTKRHQEYVTFDEVFFAEDISLFPDWAGLCGGLEVFKLSSTRSLKAG